MSLKDSFVSYVKPYAAVQSSKSSTASRYSQEAGSVFTTPRTSTSSYSTSFTSNNNNIANMPFGNTYFDDIPRLVKTPWEADRTMRATMPRSTARNRPATSRSLPERFFREMPDEIYECIVAQLQVLYFSDSAGTCISCYTRDLYNLALTSTTWYRAARRQLYAQIWLVNEAHAGGGSEAPWTRFKLLRRTLRDRPMLARFVKELHFPDAQLVYQESPMHERQMIINSLASLVMAAPNLEKFSGLYLTYDHVFDRLTHALSTRVHLKEKTWVLRRSDVGVDEDGVYWSNHDEYGQADNHDAFLRSHDNWQKLEMLCLFGQTTGRMDYRSFAATFRSLPALRHLLISDFDASQFSDRTLFTIPPTLESLRLQDVPGITEKGLSRFFNSTSVKSLKALSLVKLEISSAQLIGKILANCTSLRRFTLAQDVSPSLPLGISATSQNEDGIIYASDTLEYLHWDTIAYGPSLQDLATSIQLHAFPRLQVLRAPSDDGGILQRLCAPQKGWTPPQSPTSDSAAEENPFNHTTLPTARREAQRRKNEASQDPFIKIVVSDEEGNVQHTYTLRTYMGTLESTIRYSLDPDVQGSDDFIAGLNDLLVSREIVLENPGFCSEELGKGGMHVVGGSRGSFESGSSGGSSSAGGSLRNLALGRKRAGSLKGRRPDVHHLQNNNNHGKGHRTRKILIGPEMKVFF